MPGAAGSVAVEVEDPLDGDGTTGDPLTVTPDFGFPLLGVTVMTHQRLLTHRPLAPADGGSSVERAEVGVEGGCK